MFITKGLLHFFIVFENFFGCFLSLLVPLVRPVSSWRMGWSPPLSTTSSRKDRPRWPRPTVVCLAGHLGVFQYWVKQGDTIKATVGIRLVKLLSNITLVGAVCRMFGANIYARIRGVHALEYVMLMALRHPFLLFFFFSSSLEISIHPYSSWNYQFISQHITQYFVHECLKFYTWNYPILFEIFNSFTSQHITKYFVHEYLKISIHDIMSRSCENYWTFTVT